MVNYSSFSLLRLSKVNSFCHSSYCNFIMISSSGSYRLSKFGSGDGDPYVLTAVLSFREKAAGESLSLELMLLILAEILRFF